VTTTRARGSDVDATPAAAEVVERLCMVGSDGDA